jgi:Tol biopolymer transport system component/predicted Ser/Thr protein kinase
MGEVFKARDTRLGRTVAIKVLLQHDEAARAHFQREARAICSLNHPLICSLYDVGEQDGVDYLVMEFIEGETLASALKKAPMSFGAVLRTGTQIAEALAVAHARGIVHRDLKPANIMVTKSGIKLLDFGLAKKRPVNGEIDVTQTRAATQTGAISGTLQYMAPEVLQGGEAGAGSDIFALGAVLYEMASGKQPFASDSQAGVIAAILERQPAALEDFVPGIPARFEGLIAACLQKDPTSRWQSAGDLRHALHLLEREPSPRATAMATAPSKGFARRWVVYTAAALLAIGGTAFTGYSLRRVPEPPVFRPFTFSGQDFAPTASPDGKLVAFASLRDGWSTIWLKDLGLGDERRLAAATEADAVQPRFSPDGASILYRVGSNLYRAPVLGGASRKIIDGIAATGASWSPDGQEIVFARSQDQNIQIWTAGANGENPRAIYSGTDPLAVLRWSPDGKTIVAVLGAVVTVVSPGRILVLERNRGNHRVLSAPVGGFQISAPAFLTPNEILYAQDLAITGGNAVASRGSRFIRQSLSSGKYTIIGRSQETTRVLDIAAPGTVVLDSYSSRQNLVEIPLQREAASAAPLPVILGTGQDRQPVYSPDGAWILFSSNRSGNADLWKLSTTTGELRRVTDHPGHDWDPAFTPDGKQIVWSSERSGNLEIWIADADGVGPRQITHDGVDAENPGVTPDGWLYYVTSNPGGRGLWKVRLDGTQATSVVKGLIIYPNLSPDGRYIAFNEAQKTVVIDTATGSPVFTTSAGRTRWTPDGKHLIFRAGNDLVSQDFVQGQDTHETRKTLQSNSTAETFGVAPDGKRVVVSLQEGARSILIASGVPDVAPALTK